MKRRIRLTESDLHRVIKESVKKVLNEEIEFYHLKNLRKKAKYDTNALSYFIKWGDANAEELKGWLNTASYTERLSKEIRDALKIVVDNYESICAAQYNIMFNDARHGKQPPRYYDKRETYAELRRLSDCLCEEYK